MSKENSKMNPQITTVEVGVRSLREVIIYPLSVADQFNMTDRITGIIQKFADDDELEKSEDMKVVATVVKAIKDNLGKIFQYVLDENEKIGFDELTNTQLMEIVDTIFEVNYEGLIKNLKRLQGKAKILWTSTGQLQKSSEKPVTD